MGDDVDYLDNHEVILEDYGLKIGDKLSIINNGYYYFCVEIENFSNNLIWYKGNLPFNSIIYNTDLDDHVVFISGKPEIGIVNIIDNAMSLGLNTKAGGKGSFACGRDTIAAGGGSFAAGRRTKAGYIATASGLDNHATGNFSFATNNANTASGERSAAFGCATRATGLEAFSIGNSTTANGARSFATGWNTIADGNMMIVGGKYNKTTSDKIVVYGNGDDADTLRDAYTLDWQGNGKYHGHVNTRLVKEDYFNNGKVYSTIHNYKDFDELTEPGFYNFVWYHKNDGGREEITPWHIKVSIDKENGQLKKIYQVREAFGPNSDKKYAKDYRIGTFSQSSNVIKWSSWTDFVAATTNPATPTRYYEKYLLKSKSDIEITFSACPSTTHDVEISLDLDAIKQTLISQGITELNAQKIEYQKYYEAYAAAQIQGYRNENKIMILGELPSFNIPLQVIYVPKNYNLREVK